MTIENIYTTNQLYSDNVGTVVYCDNYFPSTEIYQENTFADQVIENVFSTTEVHISSLETGVYFENIFTVNQIYIEDVYTTTTGGGSTSIAHIEAELQLSGTVNRHKVFTYTGSDITRQEVYTDNTLSTKIYDLVYNYSGSNLSSVVVTRVSDNYSYTKTFTYSSGNLISINYV